MAGGAAGGAPGPSSDTRLREEAGIPDGFVRVSVGIEDLQDIQADLSRGLAAAGRVGT